MSAPAQTHQGKVAIITGGSKGIGAATTLQLVAQGANVVFTYSSDTAAADALVTKVHGLYPPIANAPPRVTAFKGDAAAVGDLKVLVSKTLEVYGQIDILILNAAIMPMHDLEHTTEASFDNTMALNVKGPYFLTQLVAPHLKAGSHIVFLSTTLIAASTVTPAYLLYLTTKGAIEQMVRVISKDLSRKGISVNAVAPGPTGTELFYKDKPDAVLNMIKSFIPMGRLGTPEEIAQVIVWLSGDSSGWVSGQIIRANGGMA
ncbi:hypothetical protein D9613_008768 [Agrocybe pediades]|uniref:NAD(P)-binding protein n=1 Tax=Agrocybe pediades TaxID=84607 RepID=A0A8H4VP73_9AGAR|nr:hypothetical protein D9613_008768 [Agrocybe pediades]